MTAVSIFFPFLRGGGGANLLAALAVLTVAAAAVTTHALQERRPVNMECVELWCRVWKMPLLEAVAFRSFALLHFPYNVPKNLILSLVVEWGMRDLCETKLQDWHDEFQTGEDIYRIPSRKFSPLSSSQSHVVLLSLSSPTESFGGNRPDWDLCGTPTARSRPSPNSLYSQSSPTSPARCHLPFLGRFIYLLQKKHDNVIDHQNP